MFIPEIIEPALIVAISVEPPPIFTTHVPTASSIGRLYPTAPAITAGTNTTSWIPAWLHTNSTSFRSFKVMPIGKQTTALIFGFIKEFGTTAEMKLLSIVIATSLSLILPSKIGEHTATESSVLPCIRFAFFPTATTVFSPKPLRHATIDGSKRTNPSPNL